jgi:hypothetical protein
LTPRAACHISSVVSRIVPPRDDPGIVEQDVDATEAGHGLAYDLLTIGPVAHIAGEEVDRPVDLLHQRAAPLRRQVGHHHGGPFSRQLADECPADASRAARDDSDLLPEPHAAPPRYSSCGA